MLKKYSKMFSAFLVGALLFTSIGVALADSSTMGTWISFSANGKNYDSVSYCYTYTNIGADSATQVNLKGTAAVGDMGAMARLYNSSGTLKVSSTWSYNTNTGTNKALLVYTGRNLGSEYYYGQGQARAYNGNGYNTYTTNRTPNCYLGPILVKAPLGQNLDTLESLELDIDTIDSSLKAVRINDNGQTYGSSLFIPEQELDLIAAESIDGIEGYILNKDLNEEIPTTREEAIAQMQKNQQEGKKIIPVYAVDGKTVVGEFIFETARVEEFEWQ